MTEVKNIVGKILEKVIIDPDMAKLAYDKEAISRDEYKTLIDEWYSLPIEERRKHIKLKEMV